MITLILAIIQAKCKTKFELLFVGTFLLDVKIFDILLEVAKHN